MKPDHCVKCISFKTTLPHSFKLSESCQCSRVSLCTEGISRFWSATWLIFPDAFPDNCGDVIKFLSPYCEPIRLGCKIAKPSFRAEICALPKPPSGMTWQVGNFGVPQTRCVLEMVRPLQNSRDILFASCQGWAFVALGILWLGHIRGSREGGTRGLPIEVPRQRSAPEFTCFDAMITPKQNFFNPNSHEQSWGLPAKKLTKTWLGVSSNFRKLPVPISTILIKRRGECSALQCIAVHSDQLSLAMVLGFTCLYVRSPKVKPGHLAEKWAFQIHGGILVNRMLCGCYEKIILALQ